VNWSCDFIWNQKPVDPADPPVPMNISGYEAYMQIRTADVRRVLLLDASTLNGLLTIDGPAGKVTANIPANLMRIIPGQHILDLKIVSPTGFESATPTVSLMILQHVTELADVI
jgi:hypothetical protein